jgi:hypothetical protein
MDLARSCNARPYLVLTYHREAWVSPSGNSVRVTFDRQLSTYQYAGSMLNVHSIKPFRPRVGGVILEMKFTSAFPDWMDDMVTMFSLTPRRVPKYVMCAQGLRSEDYAIMLSQHQQRNRQFAPLHRSSP